MPKKPLKKIKKEAWDALSKAIRHEKPMCEVCELEESTQVHHIIPKARGNAVYFHERNLVSICGGCHTGWHMRWSPEEIDAAVYKTKRDFSDVEDIKLRAIKISASEYEDIIAEYKERLND